MWPIHCLCPTYRLFDKNNMFFSLPYMLGFDDEPLSRCNAEGWLWLPHLAHLIFTRQSFNLLHLELRYNILNKCSYSAKSFSVLREIWCGKFYNLEYNDMFHDKGNLHWCCCFCCCSERLTVVCQPFAKWKAGSFCISLMSLMKVTYNENDGNGT